MAFKLALSPKFWADVKVELAPEDGKKPIVAEIEVQYLRMTVTEAQAFMEKVKEEKLSDVQCARLVMCDWRKVVDDDDQPTEFNDHNRDQLLDAGFASAIMQAFFRSQPKAKEKN